MNKKTITIIIAIIIFGLGFYAGVEYKMYQIRTTLKEIVTGSTKNTRSTNMEVAKKEKMQIIDKVMGDELVLATMNFKVNSVEEKQILNSSYGTPKVAKEGTKFVVIDLDVTNTTNSEFSFISDLIVVDSKDREFTPYSDTISAIEKYLDYRKLSPSVKETGYLVYEIPTDSVNYSLLIAKAGTKELYKIALK